MYPLPFTLSHVFAGFGKGNGLLRDEGTHLCLEYQVEDCFVGAIKSDIREVRIPLEDLVSVTLTKGWLGTKWLGIKIVIQVARMEALQDIPSASQGRIELCISRKDYDVAETFVDCLHENREPMPEPVQT